MKKKLTQFLANFPALQRDLDALAAQLVVRPFKKNDILLHAGEMPNKCYFVLEGCVRQYYLIDGIEKTTDFFTEQYSISVAGFPDCPASDFYWSCVTDSVLLVGDLYDMEKTLQTFPALEPIIRTMMEKEWSKSKNSLASFIISSPEQRYLRLLETRPELIQIAPQHQIASYLGVSPESLSRIKRRILLNSKSK